MITIKESRLQYKATNGGITKRIPDHFAKRFVLFEINGEERSISIKKSELPISASESEVIEYIKLNVEQSTETNKQIKELQEVVDALVLNSLMGGV